MRTLEVILVEDDPDLAGEVQFRLQKEGFRVTALETAAALRTHMAESSGDVLVLDLGLPDADGLDLARDLVARDDLRIVMLTARAGTTDRVDGFEAGADVYLTKPVDLSELVAVIRRLGSRLPARSDSWQLDTRRQLLRMPGSGVLDLTTLECQLLACFADAEAQTVPRHDLETSLWGQADGSTGKRLEILIYRLRAKFAAAAPDFGDFITTRWKQGYCLVPPLAILREP